MTFVKTPAGEGLEAVVGDLLKLRPQGGSSLWLKLRIAWRRATASRSFADLGEARQLFQERALQRTLSRHHATHPRF